MIQQEPQETSWPLDSKLYKAQHLIENFLRGIKRFRAIAMRYDRLARNFLAACSIELK